MKKQGYKTIKADTKRLEAAIAKLQRAADREAGKGDNEMANQYGEDVEHLTNILNAVQAGNTTQAWNIAYELDTIVRDQLPARLYNYLAKENGYN